MYVIIIVVNGGVRPTEAERLLQKAGGGELRTV